MANTNSALANIANPTQPQNWSQTTSGRGPLPQPQQRVPVRPPGPDTRPFGGPQTPFARSDLNLGEEASALPPGVVERNGRLYNRRGVPLNARTARQIKSRYQQTQRAGQLRQERAATAQELGRSALSTNQLKFVRDFRASNPGATVEQQNQMLEQKAAEQAERHARLMAGVPAAREQLISQYDQQLESARPQHDIEMRNRELRQQLNSPDPRVRWNAQQELNAGPGRYSQDKTTHYEDVRANRDSLMKLHDPVQHQEQNEIAEFERRLSEINRNQERAIRTGDWTVDPNERKELFSELYDKGFTTDLNGNVIPMGGGGQSDPAPVPQPGSIPRVAITGHPGLGSAAGLLGAGLASAAIASPGGKPADLFGPNSVAQQNYNSDAEGRRKMHEARIDSLKQEMESDLTPIAKRELIENKIREAKVAFDAGEVSRRNKFDLDQADLLEKHKAKNPVGPSDVPGSGVPQVASLPTLMESMGDERDVRHPRPAGHAGRIAERVSDPTGGASTPEGGTIHSGMTRGGWPAGASTPGGQSLNDREGRPSGQFSRIDDLTGGIRSDSPAGTQPQPTIHSDMPPYIPPSTHPRPPLTAAGGEPFKYSPDVRTPLTGSGGQPTAQPQTTGVDTLSTPTTPTAPTTPTSPTEEPFVGPIDIRSKFSKWLDTRKSPEDFRKEMMENIAEGDRRMLARHAPPPPPGQPQLTFEQQARQGAIRITLQQGMLELQKTKVEIQNLLREGKIDPHQQAKIDAQLKMAEAVGTVLQSAAGGGHMSPEQLEQMLSSFMGALQVASKETNPPPNPKKNPDDPTGKDDPTAIPSPNPVPTRKPTSSASGSTRKPTSGGNLYVRPWHREGATQTPTPAAGGNRYVRPWHRTSSGMDAQADVGGP